MVDHFHQELFYMTVFIRRYNGRLRRYNALNLRLHNTLIKRYNVVMKNVSLAQEISHLAYELIESQMDIRYRVGVGVNTGWKRTSWEPTVELDAIIEQDGVLCEYAVPTRTHYRRSQSV